MLHVHGFAQVAKDASDNSWPGQFVYILFISQKSTQSAFKPGKPRAGALILIWWVRPANMACQWKKPLIDELYGQNNNDNLRTKKEIDQTFANAL